MVQIVCQWLLVVMHTYAFFSCVYGDFHGSPGKKPAGFSGFVSSVIGCAIMVALMYGAGAFTRLFG